MRNLMNFVRPSQSILSVKKCFDFTLLILRSENALIWPQMVHVFHTVYIVNNPLSMCAHLYWQIWGYNNPDHIKAQQRCSDPLLN